jgi:YD repeat-containing protein
LNCPLLPNNTSYNFSYDNYGNITSILLPTGGSISYKWATNSSKELSYRYVTQRIVTDGVSQATWNLAVENGTTGTVVTLTDPTPQQNQTVYISNNGSTTDAKIYSGSSSGNPIMHYQVSYTGGGNQNVNSTNTTDSSETDSDGTLPSTIVITNDAGQVSETDYDYDSYTYSFTDCNGQAPTIDCIYDGTTTRLLTASRGDVKAIRQYDWGSGAHGALLKQTIKTYLHEQNSSYASANIVDRVATDSVYDGSQVCYGGQTCGAKLLAQTTYSYDQDGAGLRGRVTQVTRMVNSSGATATTHYSYDSYGNVVSMKDNNLNSTTWGYKDSWASGMATCAPAQNQSTYPTSVTNALQQTTLYTYTSCTGQPVTKQDPNDTAAMRNGLKVAFDLRKRTTDVYSADGGHTHYLYTDSTPSVESQVYMTGSAYVDNFTTEDGLGRTKQTDLVSDPSGVDYVNTTYDLAGRVYSISHPYRQGSAAPNVSTTTYDALGRKLLMTDADGISTAAWSYSGNSTTATDEAGHASRQVVDALGRLTDVYEDPLNLNLHTSYLYDPLGNLNTVTQSGVLGETPRVRRFSYDALSRLITSSNSETGTSSYQYTTSTGVPCAGDVLAPCIKTDARGIVTTYAYDALNRLTAKYDSVGNLHAGFDYDGFGDDGKTAIPGATNAIGRLSHISNDVNAAQNYGYDAMGRLTYQAECLPSDCTYDLLESATYDLAGNLTSVMYPDKTSITQTYDGAGRLISAYPTSTPSAPYISGITYLPTGSPASQTYGNGVVETLTQNSRMQPCESKATLPSSAGGALVMDRQYFYSPAVSALCGPQASNNGNLWSVLDGVGVSAGSSSPYSQSFSYDNLNRLTSWTTPSMAGKAQQQTYNYDSFGNINQTNDNPPAGGTSDPLTYPAAYSSSSWPYGSNNQLLASAFKCLPISAGITPQGTPGQVNPYDASGNVGCSGVNGSNAQAFVWDAESRISQVWGEKNNNTYTQQAQYTYGADGNRVRSDQFLASGNTFREYAYFGGQMLAEHDQTGAWTDYIYANGKKIATTRTFDRRIQFTGNAVQAGGQIFINMSVPVIAVASGDQLCWDQYNGTSVGGLVVGFSNGAWTGWGPRESLHKF